MRSGSECRHGQMSGSGAGRRCVGSGDSSTDAVTPSSREAEPAQLVGAGNAVGCADALVKGGSGSTRGPRARKSGRCWGRLGIAGVRRCGVNGRLMRDQGAGQERGGGGAASQVPRGDRRWKTVYGARRQEREHGRLRGGELARRRNGWRSGDSRQTEVGAAAIAGRSGCLSAGGRMEVQRRDEGGESAGTPRRDAQNKGEVGGGTQGGGGTRLAVGWDEVVAGDSWRPRTTNGQLERHDPPRSGIDEGPTSTGAGPPVTACRGPSARTKDPALAELRGGSADGRLNGRWKSGGGDGDDVVGTPRSPKGERVGGWAELKHLGKQPSRGQVGGEGRRRA